MFLIPRGLPEFTINLLPIKRQSVRSLLFDLGAPL